jgi:hypothetical protein
MYQKLPAELRQHILRYLCIEEQAIPVGPRYHFKPYGQEIKVTSGSNLVTALSRGRTQIDHSETPDSNLLTPESHVFQKEYMGEVGAAQALQVYSDNNTFSICNVEEGVARFLGVFPGVSTPFTSVRRLQIRVKYEHRLTVVLFRPGKDLPTSATFAALQTAPSMSSCVCHGKQSGRRH